MRSFLGWALSGLWRRTLAGRFAKHIRSKSNSDLELPKEFKTRENVAIFACIKRGIWNTSVKEVLIFAYIKIIWESYIHFSYPYWKKALEEAEKRSNLTPPLSWKAQTQFYLPKRRLRGELGFVYSIYICTSRSAKTASQQAEIAVKISGGTLTSVNQKQDVSLQHWEYHWNILDRGIIDSLSLGWMSFLKTSLYLSQLTASVHRNCRTRTYSLSSRGRMALLALH